MVFIICRESVVFESYRVGSAIMQTIWLTWKVAIRGPSRFRDLARQGTETPPSREVNTFGNEASNPVFVPPVRCLRIWIFVQPRRHLLSVVAYTALQTVPIRIIFDPVTCSISNVTARIYIFPLFDSCQKGRASLANTTVWGLQ